MPSKFINHFNVIILLLLLFYNAHGNESRNKLAQKGVITINEEALQEHDNYLLHGEWLFFADTLIGPNEIENALVGHSKTIPVPSKKEYTKHIKYGTYYLNIKSATNTQWLELYTLTIYSSATVFLNGEVVGQIGEPTNNIESNKPGLIFNSSPFKLKKGSNELIVQYANFHREKNGIANSISITTPKHKLKTSVIKIIKYAIILGTLLFIIFTQLNYYFIRKKNKVSLVFALAALFIFLYICFMSIYHLGYLIPDFTPKFRITLTFWRLSYYGTVAFFVLYIYKLFPEIFYKPIALASIIYCSFSALLTIVFPLYISSINFNFFMLFTIFISLFTAGVGVAGMIKGVEFSKLFVYGFVFFVLTVVNDILHNLLIIRTVNLLDLGIFGMMLTQAQIINLRLSRTVVKNEKLTSHLQFVNNNLEGIVKRRTREIEEQKSEIETQRDEIINQRDQVKSQNRLILQQTKTITDSINYAREIQRAVLPDEKRLQEYFSDSFILYKPKDYVSGDFYWIRRLVINTQAHLLFCVADCTGHGVPGALLSMLGMTLLNEITNQNHEVNKASDILEQLRQRFKETLSNRTDYKIASDGMHITFCMVNEKTNEVHYSGAFQSLYHIHNKELKRYKGTHSIIGNYIQEKKFVEVSFSLEKGDRLYLFTDGFADQISGKGDGRFMQKELLRLLCSYETMAFSQQKEHLNFEFEEWRGDFEQIDDVLVMGLQA